MDIYNYKWKIELNDKSNGDWMVEIIPERRTEFTPIFIHPSKDNIFNVNGKIKEKKKYLNIENHLDHKISFFLYRKENDKVNKIFGLQLIDSVRIPFLFIQINKQINLNLNLMKIIIINENIKDSIGEIKILKRLIKDTNIDMNRGIYLKYLLNKTMEDMTNDLNYGSSNAYETHFPYDKAVEVLNNKFSLRQGNNINTNDSHSMRISITSQQNQNKKKIKLTNYTYEIYDETCKYIIRQIMNLRKNFSVQLFHTIFFDLNPFIEMPIISAILTDKEKSNQEFWVNSLKVLKNIYSSYKLNIDNTESWVNLLTMINSLAHNYLNEKDDIYKESYITRLGDCDESNMIYQRFKMFINCDFKENNPEGAMLKNMQYWAKKYIPFYSFWYTYSPEATNTFKSSSEDKYNGHWNIMFIPKRLFYEKCNNKSKEIKKLFEFSNDEDSINLNILFGEGTGWVYPSRKIKVDFKEKIYKERYFRAINEEFYYQLKGVFTDEFLDDMIYGFNCGMLNGSSEKPLYGINIDLLAPYDKNSKNEYDITFVPMPRISKKYLEFSKKCASEKFIIPDLIMENSVHNKFFITNEKIGEKIRDILKFLSTNYVIKKFNEVTNFDHFAIFSLDDLMKENIRNNIKKYMEKGAIGLDVYELMFNSFIFLIKFEQQGGNLESEKLYENIKLDNIKLDISIPNY